MRIKTFIPELTIRAAVETDIALILAFIRELAAYEKLAHEVVATEQRLRDSLFGKRRVAEVLIGDFRKEPAAFALFFHNFSSFLGRPGIYLEDLFVKPEMRGKGIGKAMLAYLANLAVQRGCGRFEWSVLDWNKPALCFYRSLGAVSMEAWTIQRLDGQALKKLAAQFETAPDEPDPPAGVCFGN